MKRRVLKHNEFQCAMCNGIFENRWSDEEALDELHETFGHQYEPEDCALVCDDCYKMMFGKREDQ